MNSINWKRLNSTEQLKRIDEESTSHPVVIFKHSTRCSISSISLNRLERSWDNDSIQKVTPFFLDLISFREVSNLTAQHYGVRHESPQVLVIKNGQCIYHNSHMAISFEELAKNFN